MKKIILISFDIPLSRASFRVKIWRELTKLGAKNRMRSHWVLPFSKRDLTDLKRIAKAIKKVGGKVEIIIGEKVI